MSRNKGVLALAMLLSLALVVGTVGSTAGASSGGAVAAKKKCKKKKKSASSAKKKRCKKRKNVPPVSIVRATLNWSNGGSDDVDMDLFVFDSNGRVAGNGTDAIPSSDLSPDLTGPSGSETFTELQAKHKTPFSFGVCYQVGGSVHTDYTITYVTSDGVTHTDSRTDALGNSPGSSTHIDYPADGVAIPAGYCPD